MPITIDGNGTITGASTLATTVANPTFTTPNINSAQFATVSGTAPLYAARAWVNFNGTGTVAIRASGNVTSITDNGTGDYTVNFTTAMPDANYTLTGTASLGSSGNFCTVIAPAQAGSPFTSTPTTTTCRFITAGNGGGAATQDATYVFVAVFR